MASQGLDGEELVTLSDERLLEFGVREGDDRQKLLKKIGDLP